MTYQAALSLPEEANPSFIHKIFGAIFGFFNSLNVRLCLIFAVGAIAASLAVDFAYPLVITGPANQLAVELGDATNKKVPSPAKILQTISEHNLSWYYLTTTDGKLVPATKPFAPDLAKYDLAPRTVTWKNKTYYEAVHHLGNGQILHIGVYTGPVVFPMLSRGAPGLVAPMPLGYGALLLFALLFITMVVLQMAVSKPLAHLARACYSLLLAREAYSHITGGGLKVPGAVTEVQNMSRGLRDIRRQYDEAVAARAAKEEELKRQRSEHEEEKEFISRQYDEKLAQSEARLTELHTKEEEIEFINSLSKEIDSLKSSKQVYHRVLEKLNDKFPTSIIFGAFFKVNKTLNCQLEAYLGFDEKSAAILRKIDHTNIARQIFSTGQALTLGTQTLREHGLVPLAQANSLRNIVYLPVKFQNRYLGMLAFYFVQEGQTVQERLRVLRNVVDLTARTLYQVTLYEEETEASRTDPMTGLRNKKFFYELMPQIFERAAIRPEEHPISLIIMDGDHFKSINDTYGHQVGDLMLQELAKTIRSCVRTNESIDRTTGPGDYLVRFGGEEFVLAMENTDAQRAIAIAERIRSAIESKTDWPGGILNWTISLGVATFPGDGKSADDLMSKADTALYYVKEELGRNKVCHVRQVPKTFKSKKTAAAIGGELGVFDAAGLLQSIASSQKTGVLTVQSSDGSQLWMLFEAGKPIQARLGKMAGNKAITEFLVTFEDGSFNFQERVQTGRETKLPKLDEAFNVTRGLDRCLMDGALAQDNYNAARVILPTSEVYVRPVAQEEFAARWNALGQLDEPPTPEEFEAMGQIVSRADGANTLTRIFKQLDSMPSHLIWRAAALLVQHGMLETTPAEALAGR